MLTTKKSVIDSTHDEIVRLMRLQNENLAELIRSPELFDGTDKQVERQTIDVAKAKNFLGILNNEIAKAQNLELVVAVVGTMKAGKSTTINAIVGTEVLPNRSAAMTTLPTRIQHCPGVTEARLTFTKTKPFDSLITQLQGKFRAKLEKLSNLEKTAYTEGVPSDAQPLIKALLSGKVRRLETTCQGQHAIRGFLTRLNDLVRLAGAVGVPESLLDEYTNIGDFPLIEIEFSHLKAIAGR